MSCLLCPQEELQLLILSPPPDLQTLGFDPFSGALSYHPFLLLSPRPTPNCLWLVPCRGGRGGVGRHPSAAAGGVSAGEQGRAGQGPASEEDVGGCPCQHFRPVSLQCEHRELFIRHIQGLSLEVQSELAAAIQEVLGRSTAWDRHCHLGAPCSSPSPAERPSLLAQVTQPGAGVVLALAGPEPGELEPPELETMSRSLLGTLLRLARERDMGAQVGGIVTQVEEWEDCGNPDMCVWGGEWGLGPTFVGLGLRVLDQQSYKSQRWLVVTGGHGMGYFWLLTPASHSGWLNCCWRESRPPCYQRLRLGFPQRAPHTTWPCSWLTARPSCGA